VSPDSAKGWLATLLPLMREGGPVLSLLLALLLALLLWYGGGLLRECVERNRRLGDQLVTQQEKFHAEVLLHLRGCTKSP
jgi:hypothetical protein